MSELSDEEKTAILTGEAEDPLHTGEYATTTASDLTLSEPIEELEDDEVFEVDDEEEDGIENDDLPADTIVAEDDTFQGEAPTHEND